MCATYFHDLNRWFSGHSMDIQQWAVKKSLDAVWKFSACKCVVKKFWAHLHDLCVQKRSCLPWSSDAFWKFIACKFCRKGSGRFIKIYASKNEAVCREVQTHFLSSLPGSFAEKVLGALSRFLRPKTKLFAVKFWRILEVFSMQALWKSYGRNLTINASKNVTICRDVQTQIGTFPFARFIEKVMGEISRLTRLKTKLFAVKLRRILEVFSVQAL